MLMTINAPIQALLVVLALSAASLEACSKDSAKPESQEKTAGLETKVSAPTPTAAEVRPASNPTGGGATAALVTAKSADCLRCVKKNCPDNLESLSCEALDGNAAAGPATGQTKSSLCLSLLSCELKKNCGGGVRGASTCYCGRTSTKCFTVAGDGPCASEEQAGLESTALGTLQSGFASTLLGGGRANLLIQCMNDNGCTSCFQ